MRSALLFFFFTCLSIATLGCSGDGGGATCTSGKTNTAAIACDVVWSCDDTTLYELACAAESGAFNCQCVKDGVVESTFMVSAFECTAATALNTTTSGCHWAISVAE